jgi:acyl-CoA synthetase (AMP-forming)/AMP-acid ligase II
VTRDTPYPESIFHLLEEWANRTPDALALLAPGRSSLTYGRLFEHVHDVTQHLQSMGLSGGARVALVLPNGPEMAVAALAVAADAICIPLNPAYGTQEFERYLADLRPSTLMV